jgi:hypothetical protein
MSYRQGKDSCKLLVASITRIGLAPLTHEPHPHPAPQDTHPSRPSPTGVRPMPQSRPLALLLVTRGGGLVGDMGEVHLWGRGEGAVVST